MYAKVKEAVLWNGHKIENVPKWLSAAIQRGVTPGGMMRISDELHVFYPQFDITHFAESVSVARPGDFIVLYTNGTIDVAKPRDLFNNQTEHRNFCVTFIDGDTGTNEVRMLQTEHSDDDQVLRGWINDKILKLTNVHGKRYELGDIMSIIEFPSYLMVQEAEDDQDADNSPPLICFVREEEPTTH